MPERAPRSQAIDEAVPSASMGSLLPATSLELARAQRAARRTALLARDRLRPAIDAYEERLISLEAEGISKPLEAGLEHLTELFLGSYEDVLRQIEAAGKTGIAAQNAVKRSAGTNFQGLCEYAVARWLDTTDLPVCIGPNAPAVMKDELTIHGVDHGAEFSVEPDIDICLWIPDDDPTTPIIFVSAKSSLVDRAGQAARWKMYLDLHQTACRHIPDVPDCPVRRTRVKLQTRRTITHCIVTANIYKIDTTQPQGELGSGQCRNNTFMFEHRYTTRHDAEEYRPEGWQGFDRFPRLVERVFNNPVKRREVGNPQKARLTPPEGSSLSSR
jgi:hypothetical protein